MPWIPSHDNIGSHPKTRRAARLGGVSVPAMVGHLHLLWHWTLGHAPDGDLSRFEPDDLADAAQWEGDPDEFVTALVNCGPGGSMGFLEPSFQLHDWDEYGGRYKRRQDAAKAGANARWSKKATPSDLPKDATAMRTHSQPHSNRNAEERRGEEIREETISSEPSASLELVPTPSAPATPGRDSYPDAFEVFWQTHPNRSRSGKADTLKAWRKACKLRGVAAIQSAIEAHAAVWAQLPAHEQQFIPGPAPWLNKGFYDNEPEVRRVSGPATKADRTQQIIEQSLARMTGGGAS